MSADSNFNYSIYDEHRRECYERFGGVLNLPVIRRSHYREINKNYVCGNVLDLGAGKSKQVLKSLENQLNGGRYYSLDSDSLGNFDFYSLDEVPDDMQFSLVAANQLFEHLTIGESLELLERVANYIKTGGTIIATVPNTAHPTRHISDITHQTAWGHHHSFFALFKMCGLEPVKLLRYSKRHPKGLIERILGYYINRLYRMDYCDSLMLIAKKP